MTIKLKKLGASLLLAGTLILPNVARAEHIRIAFIDPLSGPFAAVGQNILKSYQMVAERANAEKWAGNNTIEVVGFDNKGSPQESKSAFNSAVDQGFRYITQGNGSGVAMALLDAVNKHNERNPGKEVVYLNYAAADPELTNAKCSFWHFSFDANTDMKLEALTSFMSQDPNIKRVYIIGQNYAFGQQISKVTKEYLKRKRPDVQIVGDDLHPIGQVKDFSPYVAKMIAARADTIITGNWGPDLALLIRAAKDAGLSANFYTFNAATSGVPSTMGAAGANKVKYIGYWNQNNEKFVGADLIERFKKTYNEDYYVMATYSVIGMLSNAVAQAKTADPVKVASTMEGMKFKSLNGEVEMRKSDHQLQQPLYIATWVKTNGKDVRFDQENTGYGWKTDVRMESYVAMQPTSCDMKRPR